MKAAVIDDNDLFLHQFAAQLQQLDAGMEVDCFTDPDRLEADNYDIVFVDIDFNGQGLGLQLAQKAAHSGVQVVLVTAFAGKYIEEVFLQGLRPAACLLKPIQTDKLSQVLDKLKARPCQAIPLNKDDTTSLLPVREVTFLESDGHYVRIHTLSQSHRIRTRLTSLLEPLDGMLCQCHQSYAVNLDKVASMDSHSFVLTDGTHVPVSRRYRRIVFLKWQEWVCSRP